MRLDGLKGWSDPCFTLPIAMRPGAPAGPRSGDDVSEAGPRVLLRRSAWAIADQGLVSTTNFAASVLAAKTMSPEDFGLYSVGFTVLLLLGSLHSALVSEPMLVLGAGPGGGSGHTHYLSSVVGLHLDLSVALMGLVGLVIISACQWLDDEVLGLALGVAMAAAGVLLTWLARRACLLQASPRAAVLASAAFAVTSLVVQWGLSAGGALSAGGLLASQGLVGLMTGGALLWGLGARPWWAGGSRDTHEAIAAHWRWARWNVPSSILSWVPSNAGFLLLPALHGLAEGARLRVLFTVVSPMAQANAAVSQMLVPVMARVGPQAGRRRVLMRAATGVVGASALYWLACGLGGAAFLDLAFHQYRDESALLWWMGLWPVLNGVAGVFQSSLRAAGAVRWVFLAFLASSLVSVGLGAPATLRWGVQGAVVSLLVSYVVMAALMASFRVPRDGEGAMR